MRVVKLYEDFKEIDNDKIISDINDMFIELKDLGLNCLVSMHNKPSEYGLKSTNVVDIAIYKKKRNTFIDIELVRDCVEMAKDYLSGLGYLTEFYRFGYVWEGVNTRMTNNGPVNVDSTKRDNIEYNNFPLSFNNDVISKHSLEYRFNYELEGIKIVFKFK